MKEKNISLTLHGESVKDLSAFLTEFAQMQRIVGNYEKAEKAEVVRNTIYSQHAEKL